MDGPMASSVVTINADSSIWFLTHKAILLESLSKHRSLNLSVVRARHKGNLRNPLYTYQVHPETRLHFSHDSFQVVAKLASHIIARFGRTDNVNTPLAPPSIELALQRRNFVETKFWG